VHFFCIGDMHAITPPQDPARRAAGFYARGDAPTSPPASPRSVCKLSSIRSSWSPPIPTCLAARLRTPLGCSPHDAIHGEGGEKSRDGRLCLYAFLVLYFARHSRDKAPMFRSAMNQSSISSWRAHKKSPAHATPLEREVFPFARSADLRAATTGEDPARRTKKLSTIGQLGLIRITVTDTRLDLSEERHEDRPQTDPRSWSPTWSRRPEAENLIGNLRRAFRASPRTRLGDLPARISSSRNLWSWRSR